MPPLTIIDEDDEPASPAAAHRLTSAINPLGSHPPMGMTRGNSSGHLSNGHLSTASSSGDALLRASGVSSLATSGPGGSGGGSSSVGTAPVSPVSAVGDFPAVPQLDSAPVYPSLELDPEPVDPNQPVELPAARGAGGNTVEAPAPAQGLAQGRFYRPYNPYDAQGGAPQQAPQPQRQYSSRSSATPSIAEVLYGAAQQEGAVSLAGEAPEQRSGKDGSSEASTVQQNGKEQQPQTEQAQAVATGQANNKRQSATEPPRATLNATDDEMKRNTYVNSWSQFDLGKAQQGQGQVHVAG